MYRYNSRAEYLLAILLLVLFISLFFAGRSLVTSELEYQKKAFGSVIGRYRLAGWVLDHFIYDLGYSGHCKDPEVCVEEIDRTGYFRGVCDDVSRVFAYLYIKQGYGDPLIVIIRLNSDYTVDDIKFSAGTRHAEVVFFDGDQINTFYGLPGDVEEVYFASDYLRMSADRKPTDIYLYDLITTTRKVTTATLENYAKIINGGSDRISPYITDDGIITVKGRYEGSSCPVLSVKEDRSCPLYSSAEVKLAMRNICKVYVDGIEYYVLRRP